MPKMKRQFRRNRTSLELRKCPVLIAKPHNIECKTDERVNQFIMKAFQRGVGEYHGVPTKMPELGRNVAIQEFLHNPAHANKTHIFFIDADTRPVNDFAIERLLGLGKDVIAGVTPIVRSKDKAIDCMWSVITVNNKDGKKENIGIDELPKSLFKAERVGGTTLLVSRKVLQKLEPPYQQTTWNDDVTDMKLSEDFYFSDKIREAGFDIWVDPETICHHYHDMDLLDVFGIYETMQKRIVALEKELERWKQKKKKIA